MDTREKKAVIDRLKTEAAQIDQRLKAMRGEMAEAKAKGNTPRTSPADVAALAEERAATVRALELAEAEYKDFIAAQQSKEHKNAVKAIAGKQEEIRTIADRLTAMLGELQAEAARGVQLQNEIVNILREHGAGVERVEQDRARAFAPARHCLQMMQLAEGRLSGVKTF